MTRVALITGGSRGIGLSFAHALLGEGFRVAITATRGTEALRLAENELVQIFGRGEVMTVQADAGVEADAGRTVAEVLERFGELHVLVNNAGRGPREFNERFTSDPQPFWETDPDAWAEIMRTNVNGPFLMARAAAPHMVRTGWGRIVNISTSRATMVKRGNAPYGPSKAALDAMTRQFAEDLSGTGVTVNALAPGGPTETEFFPEAARTGDCRDLLPVEVMNEALIWLCSDASDRVTAAKFIGKRWDPENPDAARDDTGDAPRVL